MTEETASSSDIMEDLDNLTNQLSQVRTRLGRTRLEERSLNLGSSSRSVVKARGKQPSLLSPAARMQLGQMQEEVTFAQNQRVLARIGQLYLDQRKEQPMMSEEHSEKENDDDTDEGDEQLASMDTEISPSIRESAPLNFTPHGNYYHGFNPPEDQSGNPYPLFEDWVNVHRPQMEPSRDTVSRMPLSSQNDLRNDAVTFPITVESEKSGEEVDHTHRIRSPPPVSSQDTQVFAPSTVMRKNITKRRSQGRPRDRHSLGKT